MLFFNRCPFTLWRSKFTELKCVRCVKEFMGHNEQIYSVYTVYSLLKNDDAIDASQHTDYQAHNMSERAAVNTTWY